MDKTLLYGIISALVLAAVPVLTTNRNFYFFALAVILAGAAIGIWGHENSKTEFENYIPKDVWIESATFRESDKALLIFAGGQEYILPSQNLSTADLDIVGRSGLELAGPATIWFRSHNDIVNGITATQLSVDPRVVAV